MPGIISEGVQRSALEEIARLTGHSSTAVTEEVCRQQIRPVIQAGATVMEGLVEHDPER